MKEAKITNVNLVENHFEATYRNYTLEILRKQKLFAFFGEENCSQIKGCEENEQFLINVNHKKRCFWSHCILFFLYISI